MRAITPDNFAGKFGLLDYALAYGRADEARAALAEIETRWPKDAAFAQTLLPWALGEPGVDQIKLRAAIADAPPGTKPATYFIARQDIDGYNAYIETSRSDTSAGYYFVDLYSSKPVGHAMLRDPRVKAMLVRYGFPAYWREKGWPAGCRPLGENGFRMRHRCRAGALKMSFFAELKRRNVLRAAAFYAASAWLLVQVATQVFPFFHIAEWVVRWIVVAAMHGISIRDRSFRGSTNGRRRVSSSKVKSRLTSLSLVRQAGSLTAGSSPSCGLAVSCCWPINSSSIATGPRLPMVDRRRHRFRANQLPSCPSPTFRPNMTRNHFSDGMAEEILNALTRIKNLKVVGRASSFHYKGKDVSLKQIGADLGVAQSLEGSVRNQGDQLRITTTLLQTSDGVQKWSNIYDGKLADVFNLQESCARDIASQLDVVLGETGQQRLVDKTTDNAEAYALFIEARTLVNARVGDNLPRAIAKLDKVTALDPKFARAWSKLAVAHAVLPQYVGGDWAKNLAMAESDATRAIALDPENAEAYAALGYIAFSRRRYVEMVAPTARALALDPDDDTANYWAANQLAAMGRTTEAENLLDHILVRDPASGRVVFYKGAMRWRANDAATASKLAMRANALGFALGGGDTRVDFGDKGQFRSGRDRVCTRIRCDRREIFVP